MRERESKFWSWYRRYLSLNLAISSGLLLWQLFHLYWLTTDVVASLLLGKSLFEFSDFTRLLLILVDHTEIPALLSTSLIYLHDLRKSFRLRSLLYLLFLNSQWIHIFWITDEFIIERLLGNHHQTIFPIWLAWVAILIDYLELPVIYDTTKKFFTSKMSN